MQMLGIFRDCRLPHTSLSEKYMQSYCLEEGINVTMTEKHTTMLVVFHLE